MSRVDIRAVAEAAGVSTATVSNALSGRGRVGEATRSRVRRVADELGYVSNHLARGLRTSRSETVALLGEQIATTPWIGRMVAGVQQTVEQHGSLLVILGTDRGGADEDVDLAKRQALMVKERQVHGIIYASMWHRPVEIPDGLRGLPVVLLNATSNDMSLSSVVPDEEAGGRVGVQELIDAGHRRIAFITIDADTAAASGRLRGAEEAIRLAGSSVGPLSVSKGPDNPDGGYECAMSLLRRQDRPTGVFCFKDFMAAGCYRAAQELGLRIPEDLSVVGFDGMSLITQTLFPHLTSVALPHFEMGVWAAHQLFADAESPDKRKRVSHHRMPGSLVRGSSVGPPPAE